MPESAAAAASSPVPGGFTRARFFWPMPVCIDRGDGPFVWDLDGHRHIDCLLGFGTMILGHRHPAVISAVQRQLARGTHFGATTNPERELAETILANVPGGERIVFLNSGTEATLAAVRVARAATGRVKIAKFEGGWHGWHDYLLHSFMRHAGPERQPEAVPESLGIPTAMGEVIVSLPFNHPAAFDLIRQHANDLAGVIFEGVQGSAGGLAADAEWLMQLQQTCRQAGVIFICDEVITGFRLGPGGIAGKLGLEPDLTTLGKAIGGGFPVGALAGRTDLLDLIEPNAGGDRVLLAGTFSANPVTMVAGKAQLDALLDDPVAFELLDALGERMRCGLTEAMSDAGVAGAVAGVGSLWGLHLGVEGPLRSVRSPAPNGDPTGDRLLAGYLLGEGVLMAAPVHLGFLSTCHTEHLVDEVIDAHGRALAKMKADGILG
ncbi:MAG TPA: aminotransferase class III-fold pyridoxal phosphate-dependent enzyme [Solirubrobacteraceae bacterium]|nr:aminotransferase class III-fold pyridoxal phosphate-dependent enzyme [Solirubrobacteraceae bacterium]